MKIYVGNMSYDVTEDVLDDVFSEFGDVSSAIRTYRGAGPTRP